MPSKEEVLSHAPADRIQVLDVEGTIVEPVLVPALTDASLVSMYRDMRFCRRFDARAISLQRQGRLGTYPPLAGQEGSQIGSTYALEPRDVIAFQYREHGAIIARGIPWEYLRYWAGHERGNAAIADIEVFPLNIAIGSHLPHAVGLAKGIAQRDDDRVVIVHFGDGATSEGDVHEALNLAGVFDLPIVFLCHNNGWAISHPRGRQTASSTLAGKATAYGFEGVQIDGMDPLASYAVTRIARQKAADNTDERLRPTLIEAVEYRYGAHTTADDPSIYRDEADVERWRLRDPLTRFETFLRRTGRLDAEQIDALDAEIDATLAEIVERGESFEGDPDGMFRNVYATPTDRLRDQHATLRDLRSRHGDAVLRDDE